MEEFKIEINKKHDVVIDVIKKHIRKLKIIFVSY
jgi:hypothetical protein